MYFTSCAEVALALLSPEYPAIGTARALAEANTVAPTVAVTAKKAVTDPFSRIALSPIRLTVDHIIGQLSTGHYQHCARDAVPLKACDATVRPMADAQAGRAGRV